MKDKLLRQSISIILGKNGEVLADLLKSKSYVNEFIIAKKLNLTINQVRNFFYKLFEAGVVSYIRKKDKRKGWYTYFWKFETLKALQFLKNNLEKRKFEIESLINLKNSTQFYICENCNIEINDEDALLNNFTCDECGSIFKLKDNTKLIIELKKSISKLEEDLKEINEEIELEKAKIDKEIKKEELKKVKTKINKKKILKKKNIKKKTKKEKSKSNKVKNKK